MWTWPIKGEPTKSVSTSSVKPHAPSLQNNLLITISKHSPKVKLNLKTLNPGHSSQRSNTSEGSKDANRGNATEAKVLQHNVPQRRLKRKKKLITCQHIKNINTTEFIVSNNFISGSEIPGINKSKQIMNQVNKIARKKSRTNGDNINVSKIH